MVHFLRENSQAARLAMLLALLLELTRVLLLALPLAHYLVPQVKV